MSTYACVTLSATSELKLGNFFKKLPIPNQDKHASVMYHCTIIWSNQEIDYVELLDQIRFINLEGRITRFEQVADGSVVGWVDSPDIMQLHNKTKEILSWDSDFEFKPHMTVFKSDTDASDWCNQANEFLKTIRMIVSFNGTQINKLEKL